MGRNPSAAYALIKDSVDMAGFLEQVPLALVFGAGFLTLLTPCGYVLLPTYITYYLGGKVSLKGAIRGALTSVLGIFLVFGTAGIIVGLASSLIQNVIPHLTLAAGIIMLIMGATKAFEIEINFPISISRLIKPAGFFAYGVVYAFTGSGCTFPIYFSVLLYASLSPGLGAAITMFTYALGVAIPLIATAMLATKMNQLILSRIAKITSKIHRAAGFALMAAGIYLIYYWYTNFIV